MLKKQQNQPVKTFHEFEQNQNGEIPKVIVTSPVFSGLKSNGTHSYSQSEGQFSSRSQQEQSIRQQNKQLRHTIQGYLEQIDKLKLKNQEHESQIETLLKFNERLLIIIETQLNQHGSKKSQRSISLQPISQITQRDSDVVDVASIKASLMMGMSNLKISQFNRGNYENNIDNYEQNEGAPKNKKYLGAETERLLLGDNRDEVQSYSCSQAPSRVSQNPNQTNVHFPPMNNRTQSNYDAPHHKNYSDYQKQYSEYSPSEKLKEVLGLIANYKKQYGQSVEQYERMKKKMKEELHSDNEEIRKLENEGNQFYDSRLTELQNIRQKIYQQGVSSDINRILKGENSSKYSQKTLEKLKNIIGGVH